MKKPLTLTQQVLACRDWASLGTFLALQARQIMRSRQALVIFFNTDDAKPISVSVPAGLNLRKERPEQSLIHRTAKTGTAVSWTSGRGFQVRTGASKKFQSIRPQRAAIFRKRWQEELAWLNLKFEPKQGRIWPLGTSLPARGVLVLLDEASGRKEPPLEFLNLLQLGVMALALIEQRQILEERIHRSLAVSEIAQTINATLDLDILLKLIILEVSKAMQCQAGDIWLRDERHKSITFQTSIGLQPATRGRLLAPASTQQVLETGDPLLVKEAANGRGLERETLGVESIVSLAAVPLKTKNKIIGVMHLYARHSKQFSRDEVLLLKTLANQAAMAIDNAQLFNETKRKAQELHGLYEVAQVINEISNLASALEQIVDRISNILNVEKCWLMFYDEPHRELKAYPAAVGASDEQLAALRSSLDSEKISSQVFRTARPYYTNEAAAENAVRAEFQDIFQLRNLMAVPLRSREQTLGVLFAANKRESAVFTGNDVRLFKTLASEATVVIQNAHLYDQLHRSYMSLIQVISEMIDTHDRYTRGHSERVSLYASLTARQLNLPSATVETITIAGRLHDLGKIGISNKILVKDDRLNPEEFRKIQNHPVLGEYILQTADFPKEILAMIRHHHERYDGQGYPDRLAGEAIPLGARILAVADAFDGLTTSHKNQAAMNAQEGLKEIQRLAGSQFDPAIVGAFVKVYLQQYLVPSEKKA